MCYEVKQLSSAEIEMLTWTAGTKRKASIVDAGREMKAFRTEVKAIKKLLAVKKTDQVWKSDLKPHHPEEYHEEVQQAWDDITGAELDHREVRQARMTEIGFAKKKNVWTKIRRSEALRKGWKIIKTITKAIQRIQFIEVDL